MVAAIVGSEQPPAFTAWLPYGVVVQNNSSQSIAAICVVWSLTNGTGRSGTWSGCEDGFNRPLHQVAVGQSVITTPDGILQRAIDLRPFQRADSLKALSNLQRAVSIVVSLDSVVFASGQFVGSDTIGEYEQFQAKLTVPRNIAATLLEKKNTESISEIVAWLQSLDSQLRQSLDDSTQHQSGVTARGMLSVYQSKGEAGLYQMAETILQQPVFPLHR